MLFGAFVLRKRFLLSILHPRFLSSREPLRVNEEDFHWSVEANASAARQLASPVLALMVRPSSFGWTSVYRSRHAAH